MKLSMRATATALVAALSLIFLGGPADAGIQGLQGSSFSLRAKDGYISLPDGNSVYTWGYAQSGGLMQYPGPTLIVSQGAAVTITLANDLPPTAGNVSLVVSGHQVTASGGVEGLLTREAPPDGATEVTYTFTADSPGTYMYYSGSRMDLHLEMGLFGALIVRPGTAGQAYNSADSAYDYEYLFVLSEMDPRVHQLVEFGMMNQVETFDYRPAYFFINGRSAPDTMSMAGAPWLPNQPYNCMPRIHPGEKMLMRLLGAGRKAHPFHHHGNNSLTIARDGRLLSTGNGADLAVSDFTITLSPGETVDAIFTWSGEGLGWDPYGHAPGDPKAPNEPDSVHGKPFPVQLPHERELTFGGLYSGSPYLGNADSLPPGEGGMNKYGGYAFMWHSHNEKEMLTGDLFPGGMMTNAIVEPHGAPIQ